jgi:hypothetical protein
MARRSGSKRWEKADTFAVGQIIVGIVSIVVGIVLQSQESAVASPSEPSAQFVVPLDANPLAEVSRCQRVEVEGDDPPPDKRYVVGVWARNVKNPDGSRGRHFLLKTLVRVPDKLGHWHTRGCMTIGEDGNDTAQYNIFLIAVTDDLAERVEANAAQPVSYVDLPSGVREVDEIVVKRLPS